jgi:signal transduction histidine kinase
MTHEEVKKYWMRIATTNKVQTNLSQLFGRYKTGAKGIGRFCCRRLGNNLRLETTAVIGVNDFETTIVDFPWEQFKPGDEVTSIKCNGDVFKNRYQKTGTTLIISGSQKDEWRNRGFDYVKRQLVQLVVNRGVRRPHFKEDPGFNIEIEANEKPIESKDLRQEALNAGWGTLTGKVDKMGTVIYELYALGIGEKSITGDNKHPELSGIKFAVGIFPLVKEQWRNPKIFLKQGMGNLLEEWGGVQVRLNGFRVYPYGDDDWLNIDKDRGLSKGAVQDGLALFAQKLKLNSARVLLSMLSNRSYMGSVEIHGTRDGFEPKANREGFLDSPEVRALNNVVRYGIDWSSIYRDYFLRQQQEKKQNDIREKFVEQSGSPIVKTEMVETAVQYIQNEVQNVSKLLPKEKRTDFLKSFKTAKDVILSFKSNSQEELQHLRLIASTSTLLLIFSHEVKSLLGMLESSRSILKNIEGKLSPKDANLVARVVENLGQSKSRFAELIDMTSLIGVDSRNAPEKRLALKEHLAVAIKCFSLIVSSYEIEIDIEDIPENLLVGPLQEAELFAVLLNVLSNSIKAVIAGFESKKKIHFNANVENDFVRLDIQDNGVGLPEKYFDDVFIPFLSDPAKNLYQSLKKNLNPEDGHIVGTGSGLGLSIVREILDAHRGSIRFKKPTDNKWKTHLEIMLP